MSETKFICEFREHFNGNERQENCRRCLHNYPHEHTIECEGDYCPLANRSHNDHEYMRQLLTCQPIICQKKVRKEEQDEISAM